MLFKLKPNAKATKKNSLGYLWKKLGKENEENGNQSIVEEIKINGKELK